MRPFTIYHLFRDSFSFLQQPLVDLILKAAKPDAIFLLGGSLYRRRSESIFCPEAPASCHVADCFVLILMQDLDDKEPYEWQDKIENTCNAHLPVTTLVLKTSDFEDWLKERHPFAVSVQRSAVAIYNSGHFKFPNENPVPDASAQKSLQKYYVEGLSRAKEFLAGSELFRVRNQHSLSAFMLHQSAEQSLRTLLKLGTGYHAHTHNLNRLIRYASLAFYELPDVFPQRTTEEKRLFNLLQTAYVETRYRETYKISPEDLLRLSQKVERICDILTNSCKQLPDLKLSPVVIEAS